MVDRGEIPLQSAYMLAKIPKKLREDHIDNARTMSVKEFCALAASVIKQFKESIRRGRMEDFFTDAFEPQPYLRFLREALAELQKPVEGPLILTAEGCKTALDGWIAAIQWMVHLDRRSAKEQERIARYRSRKHLQTLSQGRDPDSDP